MEINIFLDIDGVMVHADPSRKIEILEDGFYKFSEKAVTKLNRITSEFESFDFIMTTSHQHRFSVEKWISIFLNRGVNVGRLFISQVPNSNRDSEIKQYIKENNIKNYLIIDDDKFIKDENLILTNKYTGLI